MPRLRRRHDYPPRSAQKVPMFTSDDPPLTEAYQSALSDLQDGFTEVHLTNFKTQYSSPGRAVTFQQLRDALGYSGIAGSNGA